MNNVPDIMQQCLSGFIAPAADQPPCNLPVVDFNSKWRATRPCLVERDGMRFIHDPEVAERTNQFFGIGV